MSTFHRRSFLKRSALASSVLAAPAIFTQARDKKYRTVLIGSGWWGMNIAQCAIQSGTADVVALCDVDDNQLKPAVEKTEKFSGKRPKTYKDFREILEQEKPEIAIVATPDHWHPLCTIEAIKHGCHVYVEKPVSHTIDEGKAMVKAAREADRAVQVGTHRRVSPHNVSGMEFLKSGKAGKIGMIRCFVHGGGGPGEPTPNQEAPEGLDWDMWCGPGPYVPFNPAIHPRGFRQFLNFANGTLGDWGIHWMDHVMWFNGEVPPNVVYSTGGRFIKETSTTAPDTQVATFEFDDFICTWEHRRYAGNENEKHLLGAYFYGTKGVFHMGWRDGWTFYPSSRGEQTLHEEPQLKEPDSQNIPGLWADLIESIEKKRRPVCDIEIGHRSTTMSLLGMLSLKLGRSVIWDGEKEMCVNDPEAVKLQRRDYRSPWKYPEA